MAWPLPALSQRGVHLTEPAICLMRYCTVTHHRNLVHKHLFNQLTQFLVYILFSLLLVCLQLVALDFDSFKEEEVNPAKLQKHIRELSEQLYRNVSLRATNNC